MLADLWGVIRADNPADRDLDASQAAYRMTSNSAETSTAARS